MISQNTNIKRGSSEIWSDKVSLLHIKGTQRGGEHGDEKHKRQYHGGAEGTKSDRAVVYVLLITLVINVLRNLVNPLLCNEVDKNINKTRKYPLFLHAPTVPLCQNSFVINNPPCSPFLCVTFLQSSNLKRYHSKLLKNLKRDPF